MACFGSDLKSKDMKRTYVNPTMRVVSIEMQQMLALSIGEGYKDTNQADSRFVDFGVDDE